VSHTLAATRSLFVGAWDDLWVDLRAVLHPDVNPRVALVPGRVLALGRLAGLGLVDYEIAVTKHHAGPVALLAVLAVLANIAALCWVCRRPSRGLAQMLALGVMGLAGGLLAALQHGSPALALPSVAVLQAVADRAVLEALATCAVALVALEAGVVWASLDTSAALGYPAILLGCVLIGLTRRQYIAQVAAAEALVAQTRATEAASRRAATLDERTRIAREIHDVLAHALGGLSVQLDAAELLLSQRGDVAGALERIRGSQRTAREGLAEARRAVAALRSDTPPLPESVAALIHSHREQGERGELIVEGTPRILAPETSQALMRTVQEALTNARRHAPGSAVRVHLIYEDDGTRVIVANASDRSSAATVGATVPGGYGLTGMRERLEIVGGQLTAGPDRDGWTVSAEVPS
jgi:signal transduction histidine kinase